MLLLRAGSIETGIDTAPYANTRTQSASIVSTRVVTRCRCRGLLRHHASALCVASDDLREVAADRPLWGGRRGPRLQQRSRWLNSESCLLSKGRVVVWNLITVPVHRRLAHGSRPQRFRPQPAGGALSPSSLKLKGSSQRTIIELQPNITLQLLSSTYIIIITWTARVSRSTSIAPVVDHTHLGDQSLALKALTPNQLSSRVTLQARVSIGRL